MGSPDPLLTRRLAASMASPLVPPRSGTSWPNDWQPSRKPPRNGSERRMSIGLARLREEPDRIRQGAIDKGENPSIVDAALALESKRRGLLGESGLLKAERNAASKQIGEAIRGGAAPGGPDVAALLQASTDAGAQIEKIDAELAATEAQLEKLMLRIPNPADPDVPVGDGSANQTVRTWGELLPKEATSDGPVGPASASVHWTRRPHWEVAADLKMFDLERGAKITGSGFPCL